MFKRLLFAIMIIGILFFTFYVVFSGFVPIY